MSEAHAHESTEEASSRQDLEQLRLLILAAQRYGNRRLSDGLRAADLSPTQGEILHVLGKYGSKTLAELGQLLVCESGSPSRTVDLLVRRGLVSRTQRTDDRRYVDLELTGEGREALPEVRAAFQATDDEAAQMLSVEQSQAMIAILSGLLAGSPAHEAIERRCGPLP